MAGGWGKQTKGSRQDHHVIPRELDDFLLTGYGIDWQTWLIGKTVPIGQVGSHALYTERIKQIIGAHHAEISKDVLIRFADNLIARIAADYSGRQPNDIPDNVLQRCFPGAVAPTSSFGRTLKPVPDFK